MTSKKPILDCVVELTKETSGTAQYGTPKGDRPEGMRVMMLERWIQTNSAKKLRVVVTEVTE